MSTPKTRSETGSSAEESLFDAIDKSADELASTFPARDRDVEVVLQRFNPGSLQEPIVDELRATIFRLLAATDATNLVAVVDSLATAIDRAMSVECGFSIDFSYPMIAASVDRAALYWLANVLRIVRGNSAEAASRILSGNAAAQTKKNVESMREARRTSDADLAMWQKLADELWTVNPSFSNSDVARAIVRKTGQEKFHTIRRRITRIRS